MLGILAAGIIGGAISQSMKKGGLGERCSEDKSLIIKEKGVGLSSAFSDMKCNVNDILNKMTILLGVRYASKNESREFLDKLSIVKEQLDSMNSIFKKVTRETINELKIKIIDCLTYFNSNYDMIDKQIDNIVSKESGDYKVNYFEDLNRVIETLNEINNAN
jgi:hypothetical protein